MAVQVDPRRTAAAVVVLAALVVLELGL